MGDTFAATGDSRMPGTNRSHSKVAGPCGARSLPSALPAESRGPAFGAPISGPENRVWGSPSKAPSEGRFQPRTRQ